MAILMEVIHELRHTSEETFAEYVQVYGETTVVALEAAGEEVLGGWRWLTGDHTRDLLLIRADSMADMEAKEAAFGKSMESVLESLMPFIGNMEERTGYRIPLPMANEERLDAARAAGARGVCPYIITRGFVGSLEVAEEYIGLLSTLADEVQGHGRSLVTAYANSTGPRSCFTILIGRIPSLPPTGPSSLVAADPPFMLRGHWVRRCLASCSWRSARSTELCRSRWSCSMASR